MIQFYNSMTRQKEDFHPIQAGKVSMYVCGPTVYNYIHIGNARSAVAFDTIRRYLIYRGFDVTYVSNFTDVDDKIIQAAKTEGLTPKEIADKYIEAFFEDTQALGVMEADVHPRVMDNIPEIIDFVSELIDKGYAYEAQGDVYYRTRQFKDYGKLSGISLDELREGASERLEEADKQKKEDSVDFALWKEAKPGEIAWDSPWGQGRPGWHIECSVMSTKHLGDSFDIHGGGHDLTFPHHENEIAQSEAKTGKTFANYWLHNGFVNIDDEKMSKSLGNFILVHDLIKEVDPDIIRYFMATTHYRRPINYTAEALEEAKTNLDRVRTAYRNLDYRLADAKPALADDDEIWEVFEDFMTHFIQAMDDDVNAANGITVVYEMARYMNLYAERSEVSKIIIERMLYEYERIMNIFGIQARQEAELLDEEVEALIEERQQARQAKDFQRADEIRDQLKAQGIILEDTAQGLRWKRGE